MKAYEILATALAGVLSTTNGRLVAIGSVICFATVFYVMAQGFSNIWFASGVFGAGFFLIIFGVVLAWIAKAETARERLKVMELDAEIRERRLEKGLEDKTIYNWRDEE